MTSEALRRVREATRNKRLTQVEWMQALEAAVKLHTFAEVGKAAEISRQRVAYITGPVGRRPGRNNLKGV